MGYNHFLCKFFDTKGCPWHDAGCRSQRVITQVENQSEKIKNAHFRGLLLMRTAKDYLNIRAVALFAFFTGDFMVKFGSNIRPAIVGCVDVGFAVIIHKGVYIRVIGYPEILIYPMLMPN